MMKNYISLIAASMMMVSCLDTIILPEELTVDEDFWQSKSDVAMMVNGAYAAMNTEDVLSKMIVWGDFRSDVYQQSSESTGEPDATALALAELAAASIQTTNTYARWSSLYTVINRCNVVLEKAAEMYNNKVDPNYKEGDYLTDRSQMLALRSLCYFYLVRAFRDVPYVDEAYMTSSKERNFVQMPPAEVLQHCIESLEEAAKTSLDPRSYNGNWRRVGWMTRDGINTLLADIYLWRASVMHSAADYQKCVEYCDKVIESKKAQHVRGRNESTTSDYPLASYTRMYNDLFVDQNAEESIFEIQSEANSGLCKLLFKYKNNSSTAGYLKATKIFQAVAANPNTKGMLVFPTNDIRYYASIFSFTGTDESYNVRKMVCEQPLISTSLQPRSVAGRTYANLDQNWPVYRLTDAMLMKAEALVQLVDSTQADSVNDVRMRNAYYLVAAVNNRACTNTDTLAWSKLAASEHSGKDGLEKLVMEERLREFCFEGKRWFDLLRYNYRHIEGVRYDRILADIGEAGLVKNYDPMLSLMVQARGTEGTGVKLKMQNEAFLYLPIPNSDLILSPGLRQNPAYASTNDNNSN